MDVESLRIQQTARECGLSLFQFVAGMEGTAGDAVEQALEGASGRALAADAEEFLGLCSRLQAFGDLVA